MRISLFLYGSVFFIPMASLSAAPQPAMRPALLGTGPDSLINLIDTAKLMKRGQGDAAIRFSVYLDKDGQGFDMWTYRRSPHSDILAQEVADECRRAKFVPAISNSRRVWSYVSGTVMFGVIDGRPHLRIFLNQEPEHLQKGDDFIAPQEVFTYNDEFEGFIYPSDPMLSGTVCVKLDTDATGKLLSSKVTYESPAGGGFGKAVMEKLHKITFLPGYLRGQPVACSTTWQLLFHGRGRSTHWNTD